MALAFRNSVGMNVEGLDVTPVSVILFHNQGKAYAEVRIDRFPCEP